MRKKAIQETAVRQLEIGFEAGPQCVLRPRPRMSRAAWWFRRMHQVVNSALDWTPTPSPRPEQTYLALVKSR